MLIALVLLLSFARGDTAGAQQEPLNGVVVSPIRVFLNAQEPSGDLTIRNDTDDVMRFQVSGFAWKESPTGDMELSPAPALVFYPTIFTLASKASQVIRIGLQGSPSGIERAFRIFVTQMPQAILPGQIATADLTITQRFSIPVFIDPQNTFSKLALSSAVAAGRSLLISVRNSGNAYDLVRTIDVTGMTSSGATAFHATTDGWYVLAGAERIFKLIVPKQECSSAHSVRVELITESGDTRGTLPLTGSCR